MPAEPKLDLAAPPIKGGRMTDDIEKVAAASDKLPIVRVNTAAESLLLIQKMMTDRELSPEALDKIVGVYERLQDRAARAEFADAKNSFQTRMPSIFKNVSRTITPRDGGAGWTLRYADLEFIVQHVREPLHLLGMSYDWDTEYRAGPDGKSQLFSVFILRHVNGQESRRGFPIIPETGTGRLSAMQRLAAAHTAAKRHAMVAGLGLSTCDVDDDTVLAQNDESITGGQLSAIEGLIAESGADVARFLTYVSKSCGWTVEAVADIPQSRYESTISILKGKIAENEQRKDGT